MSPQPAANGNQTDPGIFATLKPEGSIARALFNRAVSYIRENHDTYHEKLIRVYTQIPPNPQIPGGILTRERTGEQRRLLSPPFHHEGEFVLSYKDPPMQPRGGWRFGKGPTKGPASDDSLHRNVEFLLTDPADPQCAVLSATLFTLKFNVSSGLLVLLPGAGSNIVSYFSNGLWIQLCQGDGIRQHALYQPNNLIRIGEEITFVLTYEGQPTEALHNDMMNQRANYFRAELGSASPSKTLWPLPPVPSSGIIRATDRDTYIKFKSILTGRRGNYLLAVDAESGTPVMLKEATYFGNAEHRRRVKQDFDLSMESQDQYGLLAGQKAWCERRHRAPPNLKPCFNYSEQIYMAFPCGLASFGDYDFASKPLQTILPFFKATLKGIEALQKRDIIHRNVCRRNMIVMREDPPYAALIDLNMAKIGDRATATELDNLTNTAPEVFASNGHIYNGSGYTNKVDIFSWGISVA